MSTVPLRALNHTARAGFAPPEGPAPASVLLLGTGVVGSEVFRQVRALSGRARAPALSVGRAGVPALDASPQLAGADVRIVGLANRRSALFDRRGVAANDAAELCRRPSGRRTPTPFDLAAWRTQLDTLATLPVPVLVDCTDACEMEEVYEHALARGIHVVTANKQPLVAPSDRVARVREAAKKTGVQLRYEATVGAALPVVGTLQSLVRTGDRVDRIDCAVSGTLGFLTYALRSGTPLSRALDEAVAAGLTEPDPITDLAGDDVARKAVILARELGIHVELDDVVVEPFVPRAVLDDVIANGLPALAKHDAACAEHIARFAVDGKSAAYLARIDVDHHPDGRFTARINAGLAEVGRYHPAAALPSSSAAVAFYTARYGEEPLVVQGAGAGGSVTAAAVLAEVLDVAAPRRAAARLQ
jgi:bifunctional aspartokinase / homoserine dehydrogenase 1